MGFASFDFLIFFPVVTVIYWLIPVKYRTWLLLGASYFFYIHIKPLYALLLAAVSTNTWLFALFIENTSSEARKKKYMIANLILILLPLTFFKYFGTINHHLISLLKSYSIHWPLPETKFILPVGISFYTFMAISYTVDVYHENTKAEKSIPALFLYLSFFPLILCGPIERAKNMIPQFKSLPEFDYNLFTGGLKTMLWGYFMKLVVADRIGLYVDFVYEYISFQHGTSLFVASVLSPFQVYTDFGGYSLIAIGTAQTLGIRVMQNFNRPFMATSIANFWRRWHISLISWLTDYIYTPLTFIFRRFQVWGIVLALVITFIISGLWHGTDFTLIIWGFIQGLYLGIEALIRKRKSRFEKRYFLNHNAGYILINIWITFFLFAASQVFGTVPNCREALYVIQMSIQSAGFRLFLCFTLFILFLGISVILYKNRIHYFNKINPFIKNKTRFYALASFCVVLLLYCTTHLFNYLVNSQFILNLKESIRSDLALYIRDHKNLIYCTIGLSIVLIKDITDEFMPVKIALFENKRKYIRMISYSTLILLILLIGILDGRNFIYFDF